MKLSSLRLALRGRTSRSPRMSCSLMTATLSVSKPDSIPTTASIASWRGVACTVRQVLTLVRLSSLWSFNMLPMRSREPSLHSAITTFLRWACRAPTWATTASNTFTDVFEAVVAHVGALQAQRKKVVIALWSEGSRDRMGSMLKDHKLLNLTSVNTWRTVQATPRNEAMLAVVGMESGFETEHVAVISEQDILGDRLVRPRKACLLYTSPSPRDR